MIIETGFTDIGIPVLIQVSLVRQTSLHDIEAKVVAGLQTW